MCDAYIISIALYLSIAGALILCGSGESKLPWQAIVLYSIFFPITLIIAPIKALIMHGNSLNSLLKIVEHNQKEIEILRNENYGLSARMYALEQRNKNESLFKD